MRNSSLGNSSSDQVFVLSERLLFLSAICIMKKFCSLLAAGSLALTLGTTAFAQSSSSASSAMSSSSMMSSSSSTLSQWKFYTPVGGGTRCGDLRGMGAMRCRSGAMQDALRALKAKLKNEPLPKPESKMAKSAIKMLKKEMKIDQKVIHLQQKFRARSIKEMERMRQQEMRMKMQMMKSSSSSSTVSSAMSSSSAAASSSGAAASSTSSSSSAQ